MDWRQAYGPGPQRLTNEKLNALQARIGSNLEVLRSFPSGVIQGCAVEFVDGLDVPIANPRFKVERGTVIADGRNFPVASADREVEVAALVSGVC